MSEPTPADELIRRIHKTPRKIVIATTGGGASAIGQLLAVPGGSGTVLEAIVPYSSESLTEFLHGRPEQFCSAPTARAMAMAAFQRGQRLQATAAVSPELAASPIGVGCTASLVSNRPKRGPHRIHVAVQSAEATLTHSVELVKSRRSRAEEEKIASQMILNAVAEGFGIHEWLSLALVDGEHLELTCTVAPRHWQDLLLECTEAVTHSLIAGGKLPPENERSALQALSGPRGIFPGAFNPLHSGHLRIVEIAAQRLGVPVEFEISIANVDKAPLDYTEMERRAEQFSQRSLPLWFTRAPTFEEKSRLFPGCTFIVGADTISRIGQCRYYHDDPAAMEKAFAGIAERGCRFLVFGRAANGKFETLTDLPIPSSLRILCDEVPASEFREDISSTELRGKPIDD